MVTVPLLIQSDDPDGEQFECEGQTVTVSRFGARIQTSHALASGQKLRITNLINKKTAKFCVVGALEEKPEGGSEWGVAATEGDPDLWSIYFPAAAVEPKQAKALLECRNCGKVSVAHLSQSEVEALEEGAMISRRCEACQSETAWGFTRKAPGASRDTAEADAGALEAGAEPGERQGSRRNPRFHLQRPVTLQRPSGQHEQVLSENVSKRGFSFVSSLEYVKDEAASAVWPHGRQGQGIEARGKIVWRRDLGGGRRMYGVEFDAAPVLIPAPRGVTVEGLYAGLVFAVLGSTLAVGWSLAAFVSNLYAPFSGMRPAGKAVIGLLCLYLAVRLWKRIEAREGDGDRLIRRKHRIALTLSGAIIVAAAAGGVLYGRSAGRMVRRARFLARDLAIEGMLEHQIDSTLTPRFQTPASFESIWSSLEPRLGEWNASLDRVSTDAARLDARALGKDAWKMREFNEILEIEHRKALILSQQAALARQMARLPEPQQQTLWAGEVLPLRDRELQLQARKRELLNEMATE